MGTLINNGVPSRWWWRCSVGGTMAREDRGRERWNMAYGGASDPQRFTPPSIPSSSRGSTPCYHSTVGTSRPSTGMSQYSLDSQNRPVTSNTKERKLRELKTKLLGTLEEIERELVVAQDEKASRASSRRSTAR